MAGGTDPILRAFRLPALRSMGELADRTPVIAVDTREQEPLVFRNFSGCSTSDLLSQERHRDRSYPCHHRRRVLGESP